MTRWELRSSDGAGITCTERGATILTLEVPDRAGALADVVLGFDTAEEYRAHTAFFGAVVGRFANRIAGATFTLDGHRYHLSANDGANTLHGGADGFDKRDWAATQLRTDEGEALRFTLTSPDGDQGFPGTVEVSATYCWTEDHRLIVDFAARTDRPTPFNIAQHSYFNLAGADCPRRAMEQQLTLHASAYLPVDAAMIPAGPPRPVAATPFDFRTAKPIGRDIDADDPQLARAGGYDHNWVLDGTGLRAAAQLVDPSSGRRLTVTTDQPGVQFYSGNMLSGVRGKGGIAYPRRSGIALETQAFPDTPNRPDFPAALLVAGRPFASRTVFAFDTVG